MNRGDLQLLPSYQQHPLRKKRTFQDSFQNNNVYRRSNEAEDNDMQGDLLMDETSGISGTVDNGETKDENEWLTHGPKLQKRFHAPPSFAPLSDNEENLNFNEINRDQRNNDVRENFFNQHSDSSNFDPGFTCRAQSNANFNFFPRNGLTLTPQNSFDSVYVQDESDKTTEIVAKVPTEAGSKRRQTNIYAYVSLNQSCLPGQEHASLENGGMNMEINQNQMNSVTSKDPPECVCDRNRKQSSVERTRNLTQYFSSNSLTSSNCTNNSSTFKNFPQNKSQIYNVKSILGTCYHCCRHVCISCCIECFNCSQLYCISCSTIDYSAQYDRNVCIDCLRDSGHHVSQFKTGANSESNNTYNNDLTDMYQDTSNSNSMDMEM